MTQSFTPVRELKNLSPGALDKLHTLETLSRLPAGAWRFHAGDVPHGESPTLDDSSWPEVTAPAKAPKEAVWYRRTIEVPKTLHGYDISGSRVWFQFDATANGPIPQIIYFNGRRVALGDDLEPIVLFEPAKPGDKILVAVKLLHTVDDKSFRGVTLRIEPNPEAIGSTPPRPDPQDIRIQCITAANLLPAVTPARKDLLPTVEEAIAAVDTNALGHADQAAFDASLRKAQGILAPLHPVLSEAKIDLDGNSHIDAAWLWPRSETIDVVKRTFTTALQLMNEYPNYTFTQSAAQYSAWMADKYPDLNAQIAQRIKEGRWEIVGGMWVEPDLNLPGGESLVRQLLVGQREFKSLYGVTARIGWNPDSFGYNWQLPQIYKRSGLDYFVTQKMHWNDTNQLPFRLFWWESPDGSKVLTYFPTDYVHTNVNPTRISADFAESAQRNPGTMEHLDLYGVGDHGGGPTRDMLDQADHWIAASKQDDSAVPTMRYTTAQHYFDDVQQHLSAHSPVWNYTSLAKGWTAPQPDRPGDIGIPTWKDELYFEYHRGVYTTQAHHKANMRRSEAATLNTEKLASLAWLYGQPYPAADLTENWKKITFNQFHDLAAGSGIGVIYRDAQQDFTQVFDSDKLMTDAARETLSERIDTSKGETPILVVNSLPWQRNDTAEVSLQLVNGTAPQAIHDASGKPVAFEVLNPGPGSSGYRVRLHLAPSADTAEVPSLGYTVLYASAKPASGGRTPGAGALGLMANATPNAFTLENEYLRFQVDRSNGCIEWLQSGGKPMPQMEQFLAPEACGNQLQAFKDTPAKYDAWNIDPGTLDVPPTIVDKVDSIRLVDNGPLRKTVRIERTWSKSHFIQDISLDAGSDVVRIDNTIDWHEQHILLKAAFPLAHTSDHATFEIPFGSIERPTTRNNSFEKARFEVPALRWADLGDATAGVSILNDSKYGYDALGNTLRITLLRSPTWPDPDADQGLQHFTYEIYPHAGSWKTAQTVHRAYELNNPLTAAQVFAHTGSLPPTHSFVSVDSPNVVLSAVKKAEDSDALVFRMYEWAGKETEVKLHVPTGAQYAVESNMMEKPEGPHLPLAKSAESDTVTVPIHPYEILTLQVAYPHASTSADAANTEATTAR